MDIKRCTGILPDKRSSRIIDVEGSPTEDNEE
jgi:hypothetical protein